jgi:hypothetical protein
VAQSPSTSPVSGDGIRAVHGTGRDLSASDERVARISGPLDRATGLSARMLILDGEPLVGGRADTWDALDRNAGPALAQLSQSGPGSAARSARPLYRRTGEARWLDLARRAADWMLTFRYSYNVEVPPGTPLHAYRFASRGADTASPSNQHLHGYGLVCTAERLSRYGQRVVLTDHVLPAQGHVARPVARLERRRATARLRAGD